MLPHPEERQMLTLAVDVHQSLSDSLQGAQGDGPSVDPADVAPRAPDLPGQDQGLIVLPLQPVFLKQREDGCLHGLVEVENAFHLRFVCPGADVLTFGPPAQEGAHGVYDDRLARTGLASQHVKAGGETQI